MSASTARPRVSEGLPHPLGATWDGIGVNFALFSGNATKVELCLFDEAGREEIGRVELPEYTDEVWHGYLPDARPGTVYGYRVHGPYEPEAGHRFNPNKLLIDPYAKAMVGRLTHDPAVFGYTVESGDDLTFDERDSAAFVPKCRVVDDAFTWGHDRKPMIPWERTIFYETHVKGFTMRHPAVPEALRGTYAGLATKEVVDYIRGLGVTSVELLPVHAFIDDSYLVEKGMANYWGYNTIGFFAPDVRYAARPSIKEFKEMVARLHDAGIEVILDVVYNHTARGQRARQHAVVQGHRQRRVLPVDARQQALLHQRHRHREHAEPVASAGAADGQRQPALLGDRDAGGRVPLRPGHHPGPRGLRV